MTVLALVLFIASTGAVADAENDKASPAAMCGFTAPSAVDVIRQVRSSQWLSDQKIESDRFELYSTSDGLTQWVVTKTGEPASPAVTCRAVYRAKNGSWQQIRTMKCDGPRDACDRLLAEFRVIDEQARRELAVKAEKK